MSDPVRDALAALEQHPDATVRNSAKSISAALAAAPAQAEPQEGDLLHTMMEWARTEEGRKQLADSYRPHLWACAKRVADPQNEAATCRHWCGDIEHCQPIASAPAQAEPQPEHAGPIAWLRTLNGDPDWQEDCVHAYEDDARRNLNAYIEGAGEGEVYSIIPLYAAPPAQAPDAIKVAVDRFLSWPLPQGFSPDCGISFDGRKPDQWNPVRQWPVGTNLFTADEARAMFEYCLAAAPAQPEPRTIPAHVQPATLSPPTDWDDAQPAPAEDDAPVRRFACFTQEDGVYESKTGEHVLYSDYANLAARLAALRDENARVLAANLDVLAWQRQAEADMGELRAALAEAQRVIAAADAMRAEYIASWDDGEDNAAHEAYCAKWPAIAAYDAARSGGGKL